MQLIYQRTCPGDELVRLSVNLKTYTSTPKRWLFCGYPPSTCQSLRIPNIDSFLRVRENVCNRVAALLVTQYNWSRDRGLVHKIHTCAYMSPELKWNILYTEERLGKLTCPVVYRFWCPVSSRLKNIVWSWSAFKWIPATSEWKRRLPFLLTHISCRELPSVLGGEWVKLYRA